MTKLQKDLEKLSELEKQGKWSDVVEPMKKLIVYHLKLSEKTEAIHALNRLGNVYSHLSQTSEMIQYFEFLPSLPECFNLLPDYDRIIYSILLDYFLKCEKDFTTSRSRLAENLKYRIDIKEDQRVETLNKNEKEYIEKYCILNLLSAIIHFKKSIHQQNVLFQDFNCLEDIYFLVNWKYLSLSNNKENIKSFVNHDVNTIENDHLLSLIAKLEFNDTVDVLKDPLIKSRLQKLDGFTCEVSPNLQLYTSKTQPLLKAYKSLARGIFCDGSNNTVEQVQSLLAEFEMSTSNHFLSKSLIMSKCITHLYASKAPFLNIVLNEIEATIKAMQHYESTLGLKFPMTERYFKLNLAILKLASTDSAVFEEAIELLLALNFTHHGDIEIMDALVNGYMKKKCYDKAFTLANHILSIDPNNAKSQSDVAWIFCCSEFHLNLKMALSMIKKAMIHPRRMDYFRYSVILWKQESKNFFDYEHRTVILPKQEMVRKEILQSLIKALKTADAAKNNPERSLLSEIYEHLGHYFWGLSRSSADATVIYDAHFIRAKKCYLASLKYNASNEMSNYFLSAMYVLETDVISAVTLLESAPSSLLLLQMLGNLYLHEKSWKNAIQCFQTSIKKSPKNMKSWLYLAFAYEGNNQFLSSFKALSKALLTIEHQQDGNSKLMNHIKLKMAKLNVILKNYKESITVLDELKREFEPLDEQWIFLATQCLSDAHYHYGLSLCLDYGFYNEAFFHLSKALDYTLKHIDFYDFNTLRACKRVGDILLFIQRKLPLYQDQCDITLLNQLMKKIHVKDHHVFLDTILKEMNRFKDADASYYLTVYAFTTVLYLLIYNNNNNNNNDDDSCVNVSSLDDGDTYSILKEKKQLISDGLYDLANALNKKPYNQQDRIHRMMFLILRCSLQLNAKNEQTWNLLGNFMWNKHALLSQHCFIQAIKLTNKSSIAMINLGILYSSVKQLDLAMLAFQNIKNTSSHFASSQKAHHFIFYHNEPLDHRINSLRHIYLLEPFDGEVSDLPSEFLVYCLLKKFLEDDNKSLHQDLLIETNEIITKYLKRSIASSETLYMKAIVSDYIHLYDEAIHAFEMVSAHQEDSVDFWTELYSVRLKLIQHHNMKSVYTQWQTIQGKLSNAIQRLDASRFLLKAFYFYTSILISFNSGSHEIALKEASSFLTFLKSYLQAHSTSEEGLNIANGLKLDVELMIACICIALNEQKYLITARQLLIEFLKQNPTHLRGLQLMLLMAANDKDKSLAMALLNQLKNNTTLLWNPLNEFIFEFYVFMEDIKAAFSYLQNKIMIHPLNPRIRQYLSKLLLQYKTSSWDPFILDVVQVDDNDDQKMQCLVLKAIGTLIKQGIEGQAIGLVYTQKALLLNPQNSDLRRILNVLNGPK